MPYLSGKSHVIFDWNGTILNDMDLCVEVINSVLVKYGLPEINLDFYRRHFRFPVIEYYHSLGFDFDRHCWQEVSQAFIERFEARVESCPLFAGAEELLNDLSAKGIGCSILSAAHRDHLESLVSKHGLAGYFPQRVGAGDTHAHGKVELGKKLMHSLGIDPKEIILIGDTDHDFAVGRELGVDVLLLADGHQDYSVLSPLSDKVLECRYGSSKSA